MLRSQVDPRRDKGWIWWVSEERKEYQAVLEVVNIRFVGLPSCKSALSVGDIFMIKGNVDDPSLVVLDS